MFNCKKCFSECQNQFDAQNCCTEEQLFTIDPQNKRQYISDVIKDQRDQYSVTNNELNGYVTPLQFAEYMYSKISMYKNGVTQKQMDKILTLLIVEQRVSGLVQKGVMQPRSVSVDGQIAYGLTQIGKRVAKHVIDKELNIK